MQKLIKLKPIKLETMKDKEKGYNIVSELCNKSFENYYDEYDKLSDVKKKISTIKIQA